MKKIVIMTLAFALSLSAGEANKENKSALLDFSPKQTQGVCVAGVDLEVNRKGCCSRHEGVCGCDGDRVKCCGGTLSPTCKCGE